MRKNKINEVIRVAAVSVLSIGMFTAAFIGSNSIVFAAATSKTKTLTPAAVTAANIPNRDARQEPRSVVTDVRNSAVSQETQTRQVAGMTVLFTDSNVKRIQSMLSERENADMLSVEKAAELGVQYINDIFEEDITGRTVYLGLTFAGRNSAEGEITWNGRVAESEQALNDGLHMYDFDLDAVTGERINVEVRQKRIGSADYDSAENSLPEKTITREEMERLSGATPDINLEPHEQLAWDFAQKHFNNTNVMDVVFNNARVNITGRSVETDDYYKYDYTTLSFIASDETGRKAEVTLMMETEKLIGIRTVVETPARVRTPEGYENREDNQASREEAARRSEFPDGYNRYEEYKPTR